MSKQERRERQAAAKAASPKTARFADYFWANVIFWAFLLVMAGLVWKTCQDPNDDPNVKAVLADTFQFIFLLFGLGFTLVTLFDAAYDYFATRAEEPAGQETKPATR